MRNGLLRVASPRKQERTCATCPFGFFVTAFIIPRAKTAAVIAPCSPVLSPPSFAIRDFKEKIACMSPSSGVSFALFRKSFMSSSVSSSPSRETSAIVKSLSNNSCRCGGGIGIAREVVPPLPFRVSSIVRLNKHSANVRPVRGVHAHRTFRFFFFDFFGRVESSSDASSSACVGLAITSVLSPTPLPSSSSLLLFEPDEEEEEEEGHSELELELLGPLVG